MDTYVNLNGKCIKLGENSLIGISEEPIRQIVASISSDKGGSKIVFKKLEIKEEKVDDEIEESPMDRVCPKCGKIALDEEAFCTNCGTKI